MMKRATCIIIAALICSSALFAWIGDVSLTNVKFNGTIENVGENADGKHSDVTISVTKETAQGSVYTIGKAGSGGECWINNLSISGNKAFTVNLFNCTIYGEVKITGGTVTFSGCTFEGTDGEKPAFDCTGMTGGSVTVTGGSVSHPTQFTMDFHGSGVTEVSITGLGGTASSAIKKIDVSGDTDLASFTLGDNIYVSTLDMSRCTNNELLETIEDQWNNWKITGQTQYTATGGNLSVSGDKKGLILSNMGLTGTDVNIRNESLVSLDISRNSGMTQLSVNSELSFSLLKTLDASDCGLTYVSVNIVNDSNSVLKLDKNSLGAEKTIQRYYAYVDREMTRTDYAYDDVPFSSIGSAPTSTSGNALNTEYIEVRNLTSTSGYVPLEDDGEGNIVGGYEWKTWTWTESGYINIMVGSSIMINGKKITTHFQAGRNISNDPDDNTRYVFPDILSDLLSGKNISLNSSLSISSIVKNLNWSRPNDGTFSEANTSQSSMANSNGKNYTAFLEFDFASEWTAAGANQVRVDLSNNGISYNAGYTSGGSSYNPKGEWLVRFKLRTGYSASDCYIAEMTTGSTKTTSSNFRSYLKINGGYAWDTGYHGDNMDSGEKIYFTKNGTRVGGSYNSSYSALGNGSTVSFDLYRYKNSNASGGNGIDMYIHPFGDKKTNVDPDFDSVCND